MNTLNRKKLALIIILSLAVQIIYLFLNPLTYPKMDATLYDAIASNLASGRGFSIDGDKPTSLYPLYPLFLAALYKLFGHNYLIVQLIMSFFVALTCALIYIIGTLVFQEKSGFASAVFMLLYPPIFSLSRIMYAEPLVIFLEYLSIFILLLAFRYNKLFYIFCAGFLLAMAILTKPNVCYIVLVFAFSVFYFFSFKRALNSLLALFLGILFCMSPWIIRNYIVFGDFRPVGVFAVKGTKIAKVDWASQYKKEKMIDGGYKHQEQRIGEFYQRAKIAIPVSSNENIFKKAVSYFGSDYAGYPANALDLIRKMYITSYSDIFDIGIPFKAFAQDANIAKHYWQFLLLKLFMLIVSFVLFIFGLCGIIQNLFQKKEMFFLSTVFIAHPLFYYLWAVFFGAIIGPRYGVPSLGILIIFAVVQVLKMRDGVAKVKMSIKY